MQFKKICDSNQLKKYLLGEHSSASLNIWSQMKLIRCSVLLLMSYWVNIACESSPTSHEVKHRSNASGVKSSTRVSRPRFSSVKKPADCGALWQNKYAQLHADILAGRRSQKYLVVVPPFSGLADKLTALPSQLFWAILSDRALVTVPIPGFPLWSDIFEFPNINMTAPNRLHVVFEGEKYWCDVPENIGKGKRQLCWHNYSLRRGGLLANFNFSSFAEDIPLLYVQTNRGLSYGLFESIIHNKTLISWGLNPENAFGCALHFMIRLAEKSVHCSQQCMLVKRSIQEAQRSGIAVIGVHVRIGDRVWSGREPALPEASAHFQCARDIADDLLAVGGTKSVVYLISDSLNLIRAAQARYGDWIIADNATKPEHVGFICTSQSNSSECATKVQETAHELFLFSRADFHVVTNNSGFGMVGAWMNTNRPIKDRVYKVYKRSARCTFGSYKDVVTDPAALSFSWSGI